MTNFGVPPDRRIAWPSCGSREITLEKIRIDIPLPIPRCVISSPIHMIIAVPAVMTSTISAMFAAVNDPGREDVDAAEPLRAAGLWNRNTRPVDCRSASTTVT